MAARNGNIRNYFMQSQPSQVSQPSQQSTSSTKPSIATIPSSSASPEAIMIAPEQPVTQFSSQKVIKSSDDEGSSSDSDCELLPLSALLTTSNVSKNNNHREAMTPVRHGKSRKTTNFPTSPLAVMPKYKFDMKTLVNQAEKNDATEASSLRVQALLANDTTTDLSANISSSTHNEILGSVIADKEGVVADKILRAVQRTEATQIPHRWYFFDSEYESIVVRDPISSSCARVGWHEGLVDPRTMEETVLSGFARDMVTLGDYLPDELFLWMLDELCLGSRQDLRQAYCDILLSSPKQLKKLVQPSRISRMFQNLRGKQSAVDIDRSIVPIPGSRRAYEGIDWTTLRTVVMFLGKISDHTPPPTNIHAILILCRLCADTVVSDSVSLLAGVQDAIHQLSKNIDNVSWKSSCQDVCKSLFDTVQSPVLQSQILRCIPAFSPRLNDLRRRLAMCFFTEDLDYANNAACEVIDLWTLTKVLDGPRFKIYERTDYHGLAALMSILDVSVDNGLSANIDMGDPEAEIEFNADVDALGARVKAIWSGINDSGASFISRIDAKEVMEGVRHRLIYGVRSRAKPKRGIFDAVQDNSPEIKKQGAFMDRIFKEGKTG